MNVLVSPYTPSMITRDNMVCAIYFTLDTFNKRVLCSSLPDLQMSSHKSFRFAFQESLESYI